MAYGKSVNSGNFVPGFRVVSGGSLMRAFAKMFQGGLDRATGIVAKAGGTKAAAVPLVNSLNLVATCATLNDSVLMPKAIAGSVVFITNNGAQTLAIYGQGTDTIDGAATATADTLAAGKTACWVCYATGAWFSIQSA